MVVVCIVRSGLYGDSFVHSCQQDVGISMVTVARQQLHCIKIHNIYIQHINCNRYSYYSVFLSYFSCLSLIEMFIVPPQDVKLKLTWLGELKETGVVNFIIIHSHFLKIKNIWNCFTLLLRRTLVITNFLKAMMTNLFHYWLLIYSCVI